MKFDFFLNNLSKIEKIKVNSALAHSEFSPKDRPEFAEDYKTTKTRNAGVMAVFSPIKDEVHVTLIVRTTYDGAHSGQVAFAGGKWEKEDKSFQDTAFREVEEEIGVSKNDLTFCRSLTSVYIPPSDFRVYPFLAYSKKKLSYIPQEEEVAKVITIPLSALLQDNVRRQVTSVVVNNKTIIAPAFVYEDYVIWGATAMMLNELIQVILKSME